MKKIIFTLVCVFGMNITAFAFQNSVVMLQHEGNITNYEPDQINDALEAAVDGDAIFLSEGTFPAFNINKKVSIKGTGQLTFIDGSIDIEIPNEPTLKEALLSCLKIKGNLTVKAALKNLNISQCRVGGVDFVANTYESIIDRCDIGSAYLNKQYSETVTIDGVSKTFTYPYIKGLSFVNCYIGSADFGESANRDAYSCQNTTFINCQVAFYWYIIGTFINSVFHRTSTQGGYAQVLNSEVYNCYAYKSFSFSNCVTQNCYSSEEHKPNSDDFAELGYFGNDGTIIGPLGGTNPFTLVPTVPHVTESSLKVDPQKKELNVTVTVSPK